MDALNDQSALGAYNAVEAAGRESDVYIGSHGCDAPAIENLKNKEENCWIGSVAYFPERYGEYLVPLMDDLLHGKEIPEESFRTMYLSINPTLTSIIKPGEVGIWIKEQTLLEMKGITKVFPA